jgi:hypothetical protein
MPLEYIHQYVKDCLTFLRSKDSVKTNTFEFYEHGAFTDNSYEGMHKYRISPFKLFY